MGAVVTLVVNCEKCDQVKIRPTSSRFYCEINVDSKYMHYSFVCPQCSMLNVVTASPFIMDLLFKNGIAPTLTCNPKELSDPVRFHSSSLSASEIESFLTFFDVEVQIFFETHQSKGTE